MRVSQETKVEAFAARAVNDAVKKMRTRFGFGWGSLGPDLRQALVRADVLCTIGGFAGLDNINKDAVLAIAQAAVEYDGEE
jgi:hypothetical protein